MKHQNNGFCYSYFYYYTIGVYLDVTVKLRFIIRVKFVIIIKKWYCFIRQHFNNTTYCTYLFVVYVLDE